MIFNSNANHEATFYVKMVNEFNNVYSIKNNLNITIEITPIKMLLEKKTFDDYTYTYYSSINKNKKVFDLIHFYSSKSKTHGNHFVDLRKYFSDKELEKIYDKRILDNTCTNSDNTLIGLVNTSI